MSWSKLGDGKTQEYDQLHPVKAARLTATYRDAPGIVDQLANCTIRR